MLKNKLLLSVAGLVVVAGAVGAGFYLAKISAPKPTFAAVVGSSEASPASFDGPLLPGVCLLSQNAVYTNAKVGQAATARYRQLTAEAQAELAPGQQALQAEAKQLQSQKASLPPALFLARQQALAEHVRQLQLIDNQRSRELEATRVKALKQIAISAQPFIAAAYRVNHCAVLFSRDAILAGNPGMDITPSVIQGLDGKITTITFDRENLSAPAQPSSH